MITFVAAVSIICYHEMVGLQRMPRPEVFVYAVGVWAVLGLIAELGSYEIALALGAGVVLSMLYTLVLVGRPLIYKKPGPKTEDTEVPKSPGPKENAAKHT